MYDLKLMILKICIFIQTILKKQFSFLKLYFIDYAITVTPTFSLCPLPPSTPTSLRQSKHNCSCSWVMCISSLAISFLHPHGYCVTTYLYLITSPLHPFPHTPISSGSHQNTLCIHDSVSVLVCLVCFLDSIVDRYVFISIIHILFCFFS